MTTFFEQDHQSSIDMVEQDDLMNELYRQMFMVAYGMVRNKSDAMDIVQESWLKILQKIDTLKDRDKIIQWAKVIAHHTAVNMVRKKNLTKTMAVNETAATYEYSSLSEVEDIVVGKVILECMDQLDQDTRTIIKYKFYSGMKDKEIANKLELPIGTVKAKLHRGKEKLRVMLTDIYTPVKENT